MKPVSHSKGGFKLSGGFLLIEILTALAILGVLVVVIMLALARGIQWNYEARLRLQALNAAKTTLEHLAQGRLSSVSGKKIQGCTVTIRRGDALINQGAHDKKISQTRKPIEDFKVVVVTSEWESSSGEKKSVQLLAGIMTTKGQGPA